MRFETGFRTSAFLLTLSEHNFWVEEFDSSKVSFATYVPNVMSNYNPLKCILLNLNGESLEQWFSTLKAWWPTKDKYEHFGGPPLSF
jgi:hypothetical protein